MTKPVRSCLDFVKYIAGLVWAVYHTLGLPTLADKPRIEMSSGSRRKVRTFGDSGKREEGYLDWEEYFMATAFLSGMRSKDPVTQVGACIVNPKNRIVGTGYNGMPNNCSDRLLPWHKHKDETDVSKLGSKDYYVCHAEMNAVINKFSADLEGCTIYVSLFPCNECAKIIIQSGIKKVVYYSDKKKAKENVNAAKILFEEARVETSQYNRNKRTKVELDFESIENKPQPRKKARKD